MLRGDARPGVADVDDHASVLGPRSNRDFPAVYDGLARVDQNVHEDLVELLGIALDLGQRAVLLPDRGLVLEFVPDDLQRRLQALVDVGIGEFVLAGMGEVLQGQHDFLHALRPLPGLPDQALRIVEDVVDVERFLE